MDKNSISKRFYNEKEIGELIQRATELQEKLADAPGDGLSLEEIEHIAEELGLSPDLVKRAAFEMEIDQDLEASYRLVGSPFVIDHTLMVEGEITDEQWERVLLKFRQITGHSGQVSQTGDTREWSRSTEDGGTIIEKTQVLLSPERDHTSIQIRKYYRGAAYFAYALAFFISATATGIGLDGSGLSDFLSFALVVGGGLGGLAAARAGISVWAARQKKRLKKLADTLYESLSISRPNADITGQQKERIEIPEQEEDLQNTSDADRNRTRG